MRTRTIVAAGFRIRDHTVSHPYLARPGDATVRQEILGAARQITAVTGEGCGPGYSFVTLDALTGRAGRLALVSK
jgi:peptidoglycan/xylan/chitin deacetylase (PgdA/CDA1 family)